MRACYVIFLLAYGVRAAELPRFGDYPVALSKIERYTKALIPKTNDGARCLRDLKYDRPAAPDFADRFTFAESGCGTGCAEFCLIDRVSGEVFPGLRAGGFVGYPGFREGHGLDFEYQRDSRLVIIKHTDGMYGDDDLFFADCYVWQEGEFRFLGRWQTTFGNAQRTSAVNWERAIVFAPNEPTWRSK